MNSGLMLRPLMRSSQILKNSSANRKSKELWCMNILNKHGNQCQRNLELETRKRRSKSESFWKDLIAKSTQKEFTSSME